MLARDFTYPWRGARAILDGQNPYAFIHPTGPAPYDMWFMYPLMAPLSILPLAVLSVQAAGVLFVGLGAGLLTYSLSGDGMGRLWLLLSAPFAMSVVLAQWSPILIAAALLTPLSWLLTCKPIGLALFAWRPSWRAVVLCSLAIGVSFLVQPIWLVEWIRNARTVPAHGAPVLHALGSVALLSLIRWRRGDARLVATMALIPQNLYFYDQLPLLLVARRGWLACAYTLLTWVAWWMTSMRCELKFFCGPQAELPVLGLLYLPATLIVLLDSESISWLGRLRRKWRTNSASAADASHQIEPNS